MNLPVANAITSARVVQSIRERFNPTKSITAEGLAAAHDEFDRGNLRAAAMIWEVIEDRDDLVKGVAAKRKKNIARNGFEVVTFAKEGAPGYEEALKQKAALEFFYDQLVVTHAIDGNKVGGFKLLVRQMMDAIGKRFAVHEIVWKVVENKTPGPSPDLRPSNGFPSPPQGSGPLESFAHAKSGPTRGEGMRRTETEGGSTEGSKGNEGGRGAEHLGGAGPARAERRRPTSYQVTAELRFVPLWFFENTTGKLRFLKQPYALEGVELREGGVDGDGGGWCDEGVRDRVDAEESGVE